MIASVTWIEKRRHTNDVDIVEVSASLINDVWQFNEQGIWDVRSFSVPATPSLLENLSCVLSHIIQPGEPLVFPIERVADWTVLAPSA